MKEQTFPQTNPNSSSTCSTQELTPHLLGPVAFLWPQNGYGYASSSNPTLAGGALEVFLYKDKFILTVSVVGQSDPPA